MPVLPSYRNQLIDLLRKSIDWFYTGATRALNWLQINGLYDKGFRHQRVK